MAAGLFTNKDLGLEHDLPELGLGESVYDGGVSVRGPAPAPKSYDLGLEPYSAISSVTPKPAAAAPAPTTPMPTATPPPTTQPPPTSQPPAAFQPPPAPTSTPAAPTYKTELSADDQLALRGLMTDIGKWADPAIVSIVQATAMDPVLSRNPQQLYDKLKVILGGAQGPNGPPDTKMRQRLQDWLTRVGGVLQGPPGQTPDQFKQAQQAQFDTALQRLEQVTGYGGRQAEEELLSGLAQRGLLDSGIAARELTRFRAEKFQRLSDAASRLNEILYSNASEEIRQEAILRLQSQLSLENQTALMQLQARLQQQAQDRAHQNDFLSFLGGGVGTALSFIPGVGPAASAAFGAATNGFGGFNDAGGYFGVDNPGDVLPDPYDLTA